MSDSLSEPFLLEVYPEQRLRKGLRLKGSWEPFLEPRTSFSPSQSYPQSSRRFVTVAMEFDGQELHHERLKELEVSFELVEQDGKPRAQRITTPGLPGRPAAYAQSSGPPETWQAPLHTGTVKSYDAKKGFGFIYCDQLNQDVFYLRAELPRELDHCEPQRSQLVERRVDFEVRQHENGKFRAHGLRFLASMPPAPPPLPPSVEGLSDGRIRKYYPEKVGSVLLGSVSARGMASSSRPASQTSSSEGRPCARSSRRVSSWRAATLAFRPT